MKGLTDLPGVLVGHAQDPRILKGCTAILFPGGAVGGVDVRGSASGTQEIDTLDPGHITERIHGICLSGGSAFGLEAASGVRRFLEEHGYGFDTGVAKVPIVPAAILFDLGLGNPGERPLREMGYAAAAHATSDSVGEGNVGAGTGATVGKVLGMSRAMKGGVGSSTVPLEDGVIVSALAAVNALGNVLEWPSGKIVAGIRGDQPGSFMDAAAETKKRRKSGFPSQRNTTLCVVGTNARLSKVGARKLAQFGSIGLVRSIDPVNTMADGDVVFGFSLGDKSADLNALGVAAQEAVAQAIVRAVRAARTLAGFPGLAGPA